MLEDEEGQARAGDVGSARRKEGLCGPEEVLGEVLDKGAGCDRSLGQSLVYRNREAARASVKADQAGQAGQAT